MPAVLGSPVRPASRIKPSPTPSAQVALAWVYAQAPRLGVSVVPISGARDANRLDENVALLDVRFDDDARTQLQPLSDLVKGGRYADHGVR